MKPFLIISGHISRNKRHEFEQTYRSGFESLSKTCIKYSVSEDSINSGLFHFFSVWKNEYALQAFKESPEFQILNGAFHALGKITQVISGNVLDISINHFSIPEL